MGVARGSNFASRPARSVGLFAAILWAVALGLSGWLVWTWAEIRTLRTETAQLTAHAERLSQETATLETRAATAPGADQISAQSAAVTRFNALTGTRRLPMADLLTLLEQALPPEVRISQMSYNAETGALDLSLQALEEADLPPALRQLEQARTLGSVILKRQLRVQQGNVTLVQYDVGAEAG